MTRGSELPEAAWACRAGAEVLPSAGVPVTTGSASPSAVGVPAGIVCSEPAVGLRSPASGSIRSGLDGGFSGGRTSPGEVTVALTSLEEESSLSTDWVSGSSTESGAPWIVVGGESATCSGLTSPNETGDSSSTMVVAPCAAASLVGTTVDEEPSEDGLFRPRRRPRIIVSSSRQGARASYSPGLTLRSSIPLECFTWNIETLEMPSDGGPRHVPAAFGTVARDS